MYVRSLVTEEDLQEGKVYYVLNGPENDGLVTISDDVNEEHDLFIDEYEIVNDKTPALTSTTHVLKIEHKFKITKTIDNTVQLELQHGVYSKDNVQELIDILVKVKEEM